MIPRASITDWRNQVHWRFDTQIEQDLVISRALVEMFRLQAVQEVFAFRGGTALNKLFFKTPTRYSDDIDLVQVKPAPIGPMIDSIRSALDPWLGKPKRDVSSERVKMFYRFASTTLPVQPMRLKIEVNTVENFNVFGLNRRKFAVENSWFAGEAELTVYNIEELLGTKLRALYQRKKGRDLFDLYAAKSHIDAAPERVVECFHYYVKKMKLSISRAEFEANLAEKLGDPGFTDDVRPLLPLGTDWNPQHASEYVHDVLFPHLSGDPWKRLTA